MISIFDYTNYRQYLTDYYNWAKQHVPGFSHRAFLVKAGMSGPNYLKKVMEGQHNLTENSITKFALALDLNESEANYFSILVQFNQSKTLSEKDKCFAELLRLKGPYSKKRIEHDQYDYYRDWYNIAVRETLSYFHYQENPDDLARTISPAISESQVKNSLALLERLGLIEKRSDGSYFQTSRALATGSDIQSLLVQKFHQSMAKLAEEAVDRYSSDVRNFTSVTMSASQENYFQVVKIVAELRKKVVERISEETQPDLTYYLNLELFPLSRVVQSGQHSPEEEEQ